MGTLLYKVARGGKEYAEVDEVALVAGLKSGQILGTDHCWSAGFQGWQRVDAVVSQLAVAKPQPTQPPAASGKPKVAVAPSAVPPMALPDQAASPIPHLWGIFAVCLVIWVAQSFFLNPRWEYLTIRVLTSQLSDRTGAEALRYSSIDADGLVAQLRARGDAGWEVAGVTLEMETAWPNFGRDDYVTGLQPNIRPQSMLVILKRRRPIF